MSCHKNVTEAVHPRPASSVITAGTLATLVFGSGLCAHAQSPYDPLVNALIKKGVLTEDEAKQVVADMVADQTNAPANPPRPVGDQAVGQHQSHAIIW